MPTPSDHYRSLPILALVTAALIGSAAQASPFLRCEFAEGGEALVQDFFPVQDPYRVKAISFNDRFRFKAVVVGDQHRVEYVNLYTYYVGKRQPVLLHQAKYLAPVTGPGNSAASLTGVNYLYSPQLERQFQYSCSLLEAKP